MDFNLLHLSDLHFGPQCHFQDADPVRAAELLFSDLSNSFVECDIWPRFEAIILTGDYTWQTGEDGFQVAERFIPLLVSRGWTNEHRLFLVPGNHDIVWRDGDQLFAPREAVRSRYRALAVKIYRELNEDALADRIQASKTLTLASYNPKTNLLVLGLNSCRILCSENRDLGYVGYDQFYGALRQLNEQNEDPSGCLRVAAMHHHVIPVKNYKLSELPGETFSVVVDAPAVLDALQDHGFSLLLHGHGHVPSLRVLDSCLIAGAGAVALDRSWCGSQQYQVITVDEESISVESVVAEPPVKRGQPRRWKKIAGKPARFPRQPNGTDPTAWPSLAMRSEAAQRDVEDYENAREQLIPLLDGNAEAVECCRSQVAAAWAAAFGDIFDPAAFEAHLATMRANRANTQKCFMQKRVTLAAFVIWGMRGWT
jgi:predicted phosphodiesterase